MTNGLNYTDAEVAWFAHDDRAAWAGVDHKTGAPFLCECGGDEHGHDLRSLAAQVGEQRWRLACDLLKVRKDLADLRAIVDRERKVAIK